MSLIHPEKEQAEKRRIKFDKKKKAREYVLQKASEIRIDDSEDAEFIGKLVGNLCLCSAIDTTKAVVTFGEHFPVFWDTLSKADILLAYFSTTNFSLESLDEHPEECVVYRTRDVELFSRSLLVNEKHLASFGENSSAAIQGMLKHYLGYGLLLPDESLEKAVRNTCLLEKYGLELTVDEAKKLPAFHEREIYKEFRDEPSFHRIAKDYCIGWESAPIGRPGNDNSMGDFSLDGILDRNRAAKRLREVTIERLTGKENEEAKKLEERCYFALVHSMDWNHYPELKKVDVWRRPIHAAYFPRYCKDRGI